MKIYQYCGIKGYKLIGEALANRPDIVIKNMKDNICLLIDVAIPSDRNIIQKGSEKKLKYKNVSIETQRMWNMKCFVIPVIIGATEIVTRGPKISGNYTRKAFNRSSTKTAVLGASHIIRKVLQSET
jgi:hypothetical protein